MKQSWNNPRHQRKAAGAERRLIEQQRRKKERRQTVPLAQLAELLGGESGDHPKGFSALVRSIAERGDKPR